MRKRTSEKQLLKNILDALVILPILTKSDEFNLVQLEKIYTLPRAFKQALFDLGIVEEKNQKISFIYPLPVDEYVANAVLERARNIKNPNRSKPKEESKPESEDLFSISNEILLKGIKTLETHVTELIGEVSEMRKIMAGGES